MDYSAYHQYQGYDPSAQTVHHHHHGYDPSAQTLHQHHGYDPSAQTQQFYSQPTEDYYSYAYSDPQYANNQPYPYQADNVQPSQHQEQEPNPPGVAVPPSQQYDPSAYYQSMSAAAYNPAPQQGGVDAGFAVAHQPIVQSSYNNTGIISGVAPLVGAQTHLGPTPNLSARPYRGRGGLGGGGRRSGGRGRGRGHSLHKRGPPPSQDQAMFTQGGPQIQAAPQYMPSFGPTPMPIQSQAHSGPPSKHLWCELCKVDCNSIEIFNRHTSGKKHIKNLKSVGRQIEQMPITSEVHFQPEQFHHETVLPSQDINEEIKLVVGKVKVEEVKPLWCELCKAYCNSAEMFKKHLNGKKHLKNLSKTQFGVQKEQQISASELKPEVPIQPEQDVLHSQDNNEENKVTVEKQQVEETEHIRRGSKRKMRGGKVGRNTKPFGRSKKSTEPPQPKEVIIPLLCELCGITCESQVVFQSHLVGKRHLSNAKRFLSENETLGQEVFQILKHAFQTVQEQSANASTSIVASQLQHYGLSAQPVETNFVEGISQPQLLAEGISNGGRIVSAEMETIATEGKPVVTSETTT
ncbi:hypothetical protein CASFOL_031181 [Castilleja foliolosa]|uniref:Matrin-type domain-containing protein n=1 Tax=Castilleja foliolosa TaxID=1961234 RepID=A0ABD3C4X0_9LAMI